MNTHSFSRSEVGGKSNEKENCGSEACKPDSVFVRSFLWDLSYLKPQAIYPSFSLRSYGYPNHDPKSLTGSVSSLVAEGEKDLLDLAPGGVYRVSPSARFLKACEDSSLWHFPSDRSARPLACTSSFGVRTFLPVPYGTGQSPGLAPANFQRTSNRARRSRDSTSGRRLYSSHGVRA